MHVAYEEPCRGLERERQKERGYGSEAMRGRNCRRIR